jgi:Zn-dependent metalloprotease
MPSLQPARLRRGSTALAALAVVALLASLLDSPAAQAAPAGLKLVATKQSLLGSHYWYQQISNGHDVVGGYYAEHVDSRTGKKVVDDGRRSVGALKRLAPAIARDAAVSAAAKRTPGALRRADLVVVPGSQATLAWSVTSETTNGSTRTLVDAGSGAVLSVENLVKHGNGKGRVFSPNPVATLQNEDLKDNNDANYAGLAGAYRNVTLTRLNGKGYLRGKYAFAADPKRLLAYSAANTFNYNRGQSGFEQVMAYYSITHSQEYIHSLGFANVNSEAQKFKTTGVTEDNSFYDPSVDQISFGTGGVDDAEDAEVIWHEYGHAIQDAQVPNFGTTTEAGSIGEGFGDYWAYTMSTEVSTNTAKVPLACVADWDAVSYTTAVPHCLRRTDGNKVYPKDAEGEVHADGEIWSRALFDIHAALGRAKADKIILESQFNFAPDTTFKAAAEKTVVAAQALFGASAASACTTAFKARGIL